MSLRTFFGFALWTTFATSSFAQEGTIKQAIEAALEGKEPEYLRKLMAQLTEEIAPFVPSDMEKNREKMLFSFQTMLEVMSATLEQAMKAAETATTELLGSKLAVQKAGTTSDWFMAINAAFQASPYKDYAMSFNDPNQNAACWFDAWKAAREGLKEARDAQKAARKDGITWIPDPNLGSIAFQSAQWGALNWLLGNIKFLLPMTYGKVGVEYYKKIIQGGGALHNPFETEETSLAFYEKHFQPLSKSVLFLSPVLTHLFPTLMGEAPFEKLAKLDNATDKHGVNKNYSGFNPLQFSAEELFHYASILGGI